MLHYVVKVNNEVKELELNNDLFKSKYELFYHFFKDFYQFIIDSGGNDDLLKYDITNLTDFLNYADYYAGGLDNCYAFGNAFNKYFIKERYNGTIDDEPSSSFIGYCHRNNKYNYFINFLISFFAYWRNDEGCTCFDPYNYCDDFFVSSWASLVDTCKLFYFSSKTVYFWQSFRVKYCLDHILGVFDDSEINGFSIESYYEDKSLSIPSKSSNPNAYILLKQRDIYNYHEVESKKIKKVYPGKIIRVD